MSTADVFADIHRERGFTHRRTPATMISSPPCMPEVIRSRSTKPVGVPVISLGLSGDKASSMRSTTLRQQRLDLEKALRAARAVFGNRKHFGFGFVEQLTHFLALRIESVAGNFVGHRHQLAQHAAVAHDFRITPDIRRTRRVLRQRVQISKPAHVVGLAGRAERFVDRDHVGRPGRRDQRRCAGR
jgi:hypothetical protein